MTKGRLEAFSDAVIAIIMTIMVLGLTAPHGADFAALKPLWPTFLSYLLSFTFMGIYWSNHHHLLHGVERVSGGVLWANLHLLFWLSLTPFVTAWMGVNRFASVPVALYGVVLFFSSVAYYILTRALVRAEGPGSRVAKALGGDFKGRISMVIYAVGVAVSFAAPYAACGLYVLVALMWLVPDRRFEHGPPPRGRGGE